MNAVCARCVNYRRIKSPSQVLATTIAATDSDVASALGKIVEDEHKQRESEANFKKDAAISGRDRWLGRPVMSAFCGVLENDEVYLIAEVKIDGGRCPDFQEGAAVLHHCTDCLHRSAASGVSDDQQVEQIYANMAAQNVAVGMGSSVPDDLLSKHRSGAAARKAFEIGAVYNSQGRLLSRPQYFDTCNHFSSAHEFVVCTYQNIHNTCPSWQPLNAATATTEVSAPEADIMGEATLTGTPMLSPTPTAEERATETLAAPASDDMEAKSLPDTLLPDTLLAPEHIPAAVTAAKSCQFCGESVIPGWRFCKRCGKSVALQEVGAVSSFMAVPAGMTSANNSDQMGLFIPGDPPLTQELVQNSVNFWSWLIDVRLPDSAAKLLENEMIDAWRNAKTEDISQYATVAMQYRNVASLDAATKVYAREKLQVPFIPALRADQSSPFLREALRLYDSANVPIADGQPPLTAEAAEAYLDYMSFMQAEAYGLLYAPLQGEDRARNLVSVTSAYSSLSPEIQKWISEAPLYIADMRANWRNKSEVEKNEHRSAWRAFLAQYAPQPSTSQAQQQVKKPTGLFDSLLQAAQAFGQIRQNYETSSAAFRKATGTQTIADLQRELREIEQAELAEAMRIDPSGQLALQKKMQQQAANTQMASNMMKMSFDTNMQIIKNMGSGGR